LRVVHSNTLYIILILFLPQGCSSHFFYPDKTVYASPENFGIHYNDLYFDSADGTRLHAWKLHPKEHSKGLVFVAHGNAQNLSAHFASWVWLVERGFELFIFDYRGYGQSEGETSIPGAIEDTKAALAYIEAHHSGEYVACGQSLGGTMLLNALAKRDNSRITAVVIDSTFRGFADIASDKMDQIFITWPFQWIPYLSLDEEFDAAAHITDLSVPLLLLHGSADAVISPNDSWQLFELAREPRELWLVKEAGHIQALGHKPVQDDFVVYLSDINKHYNESYAQMRIYE
jgi:alpha-beta hydrolase superfamily lysophospholipase